MKFLKAILKVLIPFGLKKELGWTEEYGFLGEDDNIMPLIIYTVGWNYKKEDMKEDEM